MRRLIGLLMALAALLCTACAAPAEAPSPDDFVLYYAAYPVENGGDAIASRMLRIANSGELGATALAERLTTELFTAPEMEGLRSPFPAGTALQHLTIAGGRAAVDLSEHYARLSGVDLSIADYCLTLTLTQIEGVNAVRITANGRELPYRKTQLLTAADVLLSDGTDAIRPIDVSLWFPDTQTGELRAQQQTLALYEGQTRVGAVLDALARGPEGDDSLAPLLSGALAVLSSRIDGGVCYVNLSPQTPLSAEPERRMLESEAIARSLLSLSGVDAVQLLVDGENVYEAAAEALAEPPAENTGL